MKRRTRMAVLPPLRAGDPLLAAFDHRDDREVVDAAIDEYTPGSRKVRKPRRPKPGR